MHTYLFFPTGQLNQVTKFLADLGGDIFPSTLLYNETATEGSVEVRYIAQGQLNRALSQAGKTKEGWFCHNQTNRIKQSHIESVAEFHEGMEVPTIRLNEKPSEQLARLRIRLIMEEAFELIEAMGFKWGDKLTAKEKFEAVYNSLGLVYDPSGYNAVEVADALADLDVVVSGASDVLGIPHDHCFAEVHDSNMSKIPGHWLDEHGKIRKGPGYRPADLTAVMHQHVDRKKVGRDA